MTNTNKYNSQLIDREVFFGNPRITGGQISPDGRFISFIKPLNGIMNIWIVSAGSDLSEAYPVSQDRARPVRSYFWSHDSNHILYEQDKGGDENFRIYAIDIEGAAPGFIPAARDLTPYNDIRAVIVALPKSSPNLIYVGINDRDKAWHDYYQINIATGEQQLVFKNLGHFRDAGFDRDGNLRLLTKALDNGGHQILDFNNGSPKMILESTLEETLYFIRFHKNNNQAYFLSNIGDVDLIGLYAYNMRTASFDLVHADPIREVDLTDVVFSYDTDELTAAIYTGDKKRLYPLEEDLGDDYAFLQLEFPNTEIEILSSDKEEQRWIIYVTSDIDPGSAYLFDRTDKSLSFLYKPRPNLNSENLVKMMPVRYKSLDGLQIPAYLSLPPKKDLTGLPAVILVHGGPWARDFWGYHSWAQFLANRGYAVLQVNFRGSTGFGKAFLNAAINEWGEKMQDDLTAGAHFLIENNYADPDKIAIMGGSYGGYATLAGLCFTPDVYAAGVSIVGPSNLFTLLETIPPYWESARVMFHKRMGNPTTKEGREQLQRQSPFFHADKIQAPLLVAQGANDPRVKKSESDQIVIAMRDLDLPVEYLNFPDEGHGFANPKNNMAFIAAMEAFLAKHIGGRYQNAIPEDLSAILDTARVDIKSLQMPELISSEQRQAPLPELTKKPVTQSLRYGITLSLQDQKFEFNLDRSITSENNLLTITDASQSPAGKMSDQAVLDIESMLPVRRIIDQDPLYIRAQFAGNKVLGSITMEDNEQPLNLEYDRLFICDGPVLDSWVSCLPQEDIQSHYFHVLNLQTQQLQLYKLESTGSENIEGYHCNTFTLTAMEGPEQTFRYWVSATANPLMVRKLYNMPQMGGATMDIRLTEIRDPS